LSCTSVLKMKASGRAFFFRPSVSDRAARVAADGLRRVAAAGDGWVRQPLRRRVVLERHPLELEEEQQVADVAAALLHVLQQGAVSRGRGVGREEQAGVGAGAGERLVQVFERVDGVDALGRRELGDAAAVALRERLRVRVRRVEVRVDLRIVRAGVEIGEVPSDPGGGLGRGVRR